jgi:hypothetical protein
MLLRLMLQPTRREKDRSANFSKMTRASHCQEKNLQPCPHIEGNFGTITSKRIGASASANAHENKKRM